MKYKDFLKKSKGCPFCNLNDKEILKKNDFAKVILARAPYHKDHLLVIPNEHAVFLKDLTGKEKAGLLDMVFWAQKKLAKRHSNMSVLYREGEKVRIGKSVDHVHVNLIPDEMVGSIKVNSSDRDVYSDSKYLKETEKARLWAKGK